MGDTTIHQHSEKRLLIQIVGQQSLQNRQHQRNQQKFGGQNLRPFKSNKNQLFDSYNKAEYIVEDILLLND